MEGIFGEWSDDGCPSLMHARESGDFHCGKYFKMIYGRGKWSCKSLSSFSQKNGGYLWRVMTVSHFLYDPGQQCVKTVARSSRIESDEWIELLILFSNLDSLLRSMPSLQLLYWVGYRGGTTRGDTIKLCVVHRLCYCLWRCQDLAPALPHEMSGDHRKWTSYSRQQAAVEKKYFLEFCGSSQNPRGFVVTYKVAQNCRRVLKKIRAALQW